MHAEITLVVTFLNDIGSLGDTVAIANSASESFKSSSVSEFCFSKSTLFRLDRAGLDTSWTALEGLLLKDVVLLVFLRLTGMSE